MRHYCEMTKTELFEEVCRLKHELLRLNRVTDDSVFEFLGDDGDESLLYDVNYRNSMMRYFYKYSIESLCKTLPV